ncbi:GNAT family acetyltransferase [Colletotrichum scovillei]|nr:GNAT family acetyltransferase [Colletotrichum scovillei]
MTANQPSSPLTPKSHATTYHTTQLSPTSLQAYHRLTPTHQSLTQLTQHQPKLINPQTQTSSTMTVLTICPPTPSETPQIASIHISSMSSNPLLPLQFPTTASLADLHDHLAKDALHHLRDHNTPRILVARVSSDTDEMDEADADADADADDATGTGGNGGRVIAFVKWDIVRRRGQGGSRSHVIETPTASASGSRRLEPGNILPTTAEAGAVDDGSKEQPPRNQQHHQNSKAEEAAAAEGEEEEDNEESEDEEEWPASANRDYLTAYATAASKARREAMGSRPFLHLTFLCTDYRFRGRGAGKALVHAATEAARAEGLPVFLESTTDAVPFYETLGFVTIGGFHMSLPGGAPSTDRVTIYEEILMILENTQGSCKTSKYDWLCVPKPR